MSQACQANGWRSWWITQIDVKDMWIFLNDFSQSDTISIVFTSNGTSGARWTLVQCCWIWRKQWQATTASLQRPGSRHGLSSYAQA